MVSRGKLHYPPLDPTGHSNDHASLGTKSMSKLQIGSPLPPEQLASIAEFLVDQDCFWFGDMMLAAEYFSGVK